MGTDWQLLVAGHYAAFWGSRGQMQDFAGARALNLPAGFTVLAYPPTNVRPYWIYATCGLSQPADERPTELFIFVPYVAPQVVELLYAVAHFHRSGQGLGEGDHVNFGRPWMGSSPCTFGLVLHPHRDGGEALHEARLRGRPVKVWWLLPVTPQELAYKHENGLEMLETILDAGDLQFTRPGRESVV